MIVLGESGSGKTAALASLLDAGYKLRVLDLDNGVEALLSLLTTPGGGYAPEAVDNLRWRTLTETMWVMNGQIVPKAAKVWSTAVGMLPKWTGDERWDRAQGKKVPCTDALGDVGTWDENCILVLDTLSSLGTAARNFHLQMQGALAKNRSSMEGMRDVGSAQQLLELFLQLVFDANIKCHVIINTHLVYTKEDGRSPEPGFDGMLFAHPAAIGKAFSVKGIAKYFNHMLMARMVGPARRIYTKGLPNVGLKSGAPTKVKESYEQKTGLRQYFKDVLGSEPGLGAKP